MTKERDEMRELGDDAKSLLRSARDGAWDAPPAGAKDRVRGAVALAIAGAAAGGALGASTAHAAAGKVAAIGAAKAASSTAATTTAATAATATAATTTAATATTAAASAGLFSGLAAKVAIAALAVGAASTIAITQSAPAPERATTTVTAAEPHHVRPARDEAPDRHVAPAEAVEVELAPVEAPSAEVAEAIEAVEATAVRPSVERVVRSEALPAPTAEAEEPLGAAEPPSSVLEDENTVIARARLAMARGETRSVLNILAEHRARFPDAELAEEADALEVRALCRAGDPRSAAVRARFQARYPASLHASAIATACER